MNENDNLTLYPLPSSAAIYERLGRDIEEMRPRLTEGSTALYDFNRLVVQRRQLWMRMNGLGPL